jgi:hypothetical protein
VVQLQSGRLATSRAASISLVLVVMPGQGMRPILITHYDMFEIEICDKRQSNLFLENSLVNFWGMVILLATRNEMYEALSPK